jgi:hypothetical protein
VGSSNATELEEEEERVVEAGAYAFSAERMCVGITTGAGVFRGFTSTEEALGVADVTATSIAPRRTSNNDLTSPVWAAIFFARRVRVAVGRNFLGSSLVKLPFAS